MRSRACGALTTFRWPPDVTQSFVAGRIQFQGVWLRRWSDPSASHAQRLSRHLIEFIDGATPGMDNEAGDRGELHIVPALAWVASFVVCGLGDAMLVRWLLVPLFVAAFYGGMIVIDLVTYPMLSFWRAWLRRRGLVAWYLVEVGGLWGTTTLVLLVLSPWWLRWKWNGA